MQSETEILAELRKTWVKRREAVSEKWSRIRDAKQRAHDLPNLPLAEYQKTWWKGLNNIEDNYISLLELRDKFTEGLAVAADIALEDHDRNVLRSATNQFLTEVAEEYKISANIEISVVESIDLLRRLVLLGEK